MVKVAEPETPDTVAEIIEPPVATPFASPALLIVALVAGAFVKSGRALPASAQSPSSSVPPTRPWRSTTGHISVARLVGQTLMGAVDGTVASPGLLNRMRELAQG